MDNQWQTIEKFSDLKQYVGKMIQWQFSDKEEKWGIAGTGYMAHPEPTESAQSFLEGMCWFIENSISPRGVHSNAGIHESDFKRAIRKIRVLSDEEAAKVELSYSYPNPYKVKTNG